MGFSRFSIVFGCLHFHLTSVEHHAVDKLEKTFNFTRLYGGVLYYRTLTAYKLLSILL